MFKYPFIFDILKRRREKDKDKRIPLHRPPPPPPPEEKEEEEGDDKKNEIDFNIYNQEISLIIL